MERLTIRTSKGAALNMAGSYRGEAEARADLMQRYRIAVERLAAYEDTGLEPEEIKELCTLDDETLSAIKDVVVSPFLHLRELIQAEQAGRLVVLPPSFFGFVRNLGGCVYLIEKDEDGHKWIAEIVLGSCWYDADGKLAFSAGKQDDVEWLDLIIELTDLDKTIFLTREEAVAAMAAQKGGGEG